MNIFINITVSIAGIFLVVFSLIVNTNDTLSAIVFKVIPMFLGLACIYSALILWGLV